MPVRLPVLTQVRLPGISIVRNTKNQTQPNDIVAFIERERLVHFHPNTIAYTIYTVYRYRYTSRSGNTNKVALAG